MKKIYLLISLFAVITLSITTVYTTGLRFGVVNAVKEKAKELDSKKQSLIPNPIIYELDNFNINGSFTVSWQEIERAQKYILEEDNRSSFTSPAVVYTGLDKSTVIIGKNTGIYYYRLKVTTLYGESQWSNYRYILVDRDVRWIKQIDTGSSDVGTGISIDNTGNVYITGSTDGGLDGNINAGNGDVFLIKYSSDGIRQWTRQFGTDTGDSGNAIAIDSFYNIYITGGTSGSLDGNTNAGQSDIFLIKYSSDGIRQWTRQFGTNSGEYGKAILVDGSSNVYITGGTSGSLDGNTNAGQSDIFLIKYSSDGIRQWTRQFGTSSLDLTAGVATDNTGNIYITGDTSGSLDGNPNIGQSDIILTKYNSDGIRQWTRQFGTTLLDIARGISVDNSGNIYITGYTNGVFDENINIGTKDIFLVKYNSDGIRQWSRQFGTNKDDYGHAVAIDTSNNIYIAGSTYGSIDGYPKDINDNLFIVKYTSEGLLQLSKQLRQEFSVGSIAINNLTDIYIIGSIIEDTVAPNSDVPNVRPPSYDIGLIKYYMH